MNPCGITLEQQFIQHRNESLIHTREKSFYRKCSPKVVDGTRLFFVENTTETDIMNYANHVADKDN